MSKIESLTPEQEARFPEFVDKWLKIGMNTDPLDFENAKEAAKKMYRIAGLPEPTEFLTAKSPMDAINIIQGIDPSKSKSDILQEFLYGAHDAGWISFYDYFSEVVGFDLSVIDGIKDLAKYSGWASFYENLVVFQDRPDTIKFDNENRLHCEDGPAIHYRDGYSVYSWHGVRVPAEWITDRKSLTPAMALGWSNIEQRRCACEILGWANILNSLNSTIIDQDEDPEIGVLVEVDIPYIGREKFLRVQCGTGREFTLPVPPEMKTALESNAWTYGFDVEEFLKPEVRT